MISRTLMVSELEGVVSTLTAWIAALKQEAVVPGSHFSSPGLPSLDYPGSQEQLLEAFGQLSSELVVCAGKCETLADVIHNGTR